MFLNKKNEIKWNLVAVAVAVVIVMAVIGVFWIDAPLFVFMRQFDGAWACFIDIAFSFEMWILGIISALAIGFMINIKQNAKQISHIKKYSPISLWKNRHVIFHNKLLFNLFSIFCSVLLAGVIGWVFKIIIGRMRPVFLEALGQSGFYPFNMEWAFNSMPSGHATASFAALVMIGLIYPKYKWLTWTLAILIGVARVAFGTHFPSDVLLGALIGMISADFIRAKV